MAYTDCTHPMQNMYCSTYDIIEWRYEDCEYMNKLLFVRNTYQMQKEADEIIASIKETVTPISILHKIKNIFIKTK